MKRIISIFLAILMIATSIPLVTLPAFAESGTTYSVGDHIQYGNYPQSLETDEDILTTLNSVTKNWISYNYYTGSGSWDDGEMIASDYMKYADIDIDGDGLRDYRAVTFTQYRPFYTGYTSSASNTYQDDNGYTPNNVYYFKYEPIRWRVLDPTTGLIMCESILDSQAYNNYILNSGSYYYGDSSASHYANDYYNSSIRKWLNEDFYNTAFTSSQKANIRNDVKLNNDCYSSSYPQYNSQASYDKIFLLSYNEVKTSAYGFSSSTDSSTTRQAKGTDYAKSQGLSVSTSSSYYGNSWWWLRSPDGSSYDACGVSSGGGSNYSNFVDDTDFGVRPACRLSNLKSDIVKSSGAEDEVCTHSNTELQNSVSATCTTDGYTGDTVCTDCGETIETGSVIFALGHDYSVLVSAQSNASCTVEGATALYKCSRCDETQGGKVIEKVAHIYTDAVTAPTCIAQGYTTYTCSVCGYSYADSFVNAKGHTPKSAVQEEVVNASCTVQGSYNEVVRCADCNTVISSTAKTIDKLAHTEEALKAVAPTCTKSGLTTGSKCSVCGTIIKAQETVPATGHTPKTSVRENEVAVSCTSNGSYDEVVYCAVCNAELLRNTTTIQKTGHTYAITSSVAATCTTDGKKSYKCDKCGDSYVDIIKATGHKYQVTDSVSPTCTVKGKKVYTCQNCTASYDETVKALGHSYKLTSEKSLTCTRDASKTYTCTRCNDKYTDVIAKAQGHKQVVDKEVPPTCTTTGLTEGAHCSACGTVLVKQDTIAKLSHPDSNGDGYCDECGVNIHLDDIANCTCNCHKSGFLGFIYKLQRFFWKLFKTHKTCGCGVYHY